MPTTLVKFGDGYAILTHQDGWKAGGPPPSDPSDYLGWQAWAEVQHKAGLRQKQCGCGKWKFPQELSGKTSVTILRDRRWNPVRVVNEICNDCLKLTPTDAGGHE